MKSQTPQPASSLSIHSIMQDGGHPSHRLGAPGQNMKCLRYFLPTPQW